MDKDPVGTVRSHYLLIGAVMAVTVLAGALCFGADEAALFEGAYGSFMSYQPEKAVEGFDAFIREYPSSSALDAAFFWKAKALAVSGRTDEARQIISSFDEKFPQSPFRQFTKGALAEIKAGAGLRSWRTPETRADRNSKDGKALAGKMKALEARIRELEGENNRLKKSVAKAAAEKDSLAKELQSARQRSEDLEGKLRTAEAVSSETREAPEEKSVLENRVRELEVRLAAASEDARRAEEKARLLALERDDALASARSGSGGPSPVQPAGAVMEREKELREFSEYVRRVKELEDEKKSLQERWDRYRQEKETELKSLKAQRGGALQHASETDQQDKVLADLRKRLSEAEQRVLETAAREKAAEDEKALLASQLKDSEQRLAGFAAERDRAAKLASNSVQHEKELADLREKLAEAERKVLETASSEKTAVDERTLLASRLKDAEQDLADIAGVRASVEKERSRARRAEEERDKLMRERKTWADRQGKTDERHAPTGNEELLDIRNREITDENISLRERLVRFERPVVKVAGKTYSQAQIDEDRLVAARVLGRIQRSPVPWHSGNAYDDFVAEQVLSAKAEKDVLEKMAVEAAALARKLSLSAQEQGYLLRFLAADAEVRRKEAYPTEEDLRSYYESHKDEFAVGKGERMVQYLTLQKDSSDRAYGIQLVSDLQREAMSGKPLEEIARSRSGRITFTRARMSEIPAWIREKVKRLRDGSISSLFTESQFIMLKVSTQREERAFDEVKAEIRTRLSGREKDLASWLADIRKEAEDLR